MFLGSQKRKVVCSRIDRLALGRLEFSEIVQNAENFDEDNPDKARGLLVEESQTVCSLQK